MAARTILIVDEAHDHRDILARLLRASGYHVVEAEPGLDAIACVHTIIPDLVLLSLSVPGRAAWETATIFSSHPTLVGTPILGTTVFHTLISRSRVRSIGCVDWVDKPFDLDDLLDRIRLLLSRHAPVLAA